jgi:hypothetical protein
MVWGGYGSALWVACAIAAVGAAAIALLPGGTREESRDAGPAAARPEPLTH